MPMEIGRLPDKEGWADLIRAWGVLLDRYEELSAADYDVGYWHKENTLTALLASAAWQSGGAGLVEFETQRTRILPEQSGEGSGDAWLKIGKVWYSVEAKLCWTPDEIEGNIQVAHDQLLTLPESHRADFGLALCYSVPEIKGKSRVGLIEGLGKDLARRLPEASLVVSYKPLKTEAPEHVGAVYPGMAAVGRIVDWKTLRK